MSALFPFIPRLDSAGGSVAGIIDANELGEARLDAKGQVKSFGNLGLNIGYGTPVAKMKIDAALQRAWPSADKARRDSATDFITSGLELVMDPGENVIRESDPLLFVPAPGRQVVLPTRNLLRPGLRTNSYKIRVRHGQAQWTEPNAIGRELPLASYQDEKVERGAEYYAIMYGYSIPETWEGEFLGDDVFGENQLAAVDAMDQFQEKASLWGDEDKNIAGFATLGDAAVFLGGQQFSSGSVVAEDMMLRIAAFEQQYMALNNQRKPTAAMIPDSDRHAMQTAYFGAGGEGDSVWKRATDQYPWMKNVTWSNSLMEANEDGTAARWILYFQDPKNLYIEHTDTMVFGPFQEFLNFRFVMLRRHGGVVNKIPERVCYVDFTV